MAPGDAVLVLVAPAVGSFLGVVVARWPDSRAILWGRSRCAACGIRLGIADLVPLGSWLRSGGRCRHCGAGIGMAPLAMEAAALALALWCVALFPGWLAWASAGLGWSLLVAAEIDRRHWILPDTVTLGLIPAGIAVIWAAEPSRLGDAVIGAAAGGASLLAIRAAHRRLRGCEGLGLGDVKLFAAAGAWVTWAGLPSVMVWAGFAGLAVAGLGGAARIGGEPALPFGPFLALGFWLVWSFGPLIRA